ncbi:Crp/Fnr family transcriptional regulator [Vibrio sp. EA2]|uniref:Crp/Fnr family transcriptional regulator n=1 Tax=Vibrio sp. EA2 TaxID=3079860 RepID=UPI002948F631|nr:Crp/Fnr family transcriptional regulator [Vibrio sp. EA2]MDV6252983.1 Crp/Fnr family transcriptional regulator [Vibrio sp. EA2]
MKCLAHSTEVDGDINSLVYGFHSRHLKSGELLSYPQDGDNRVFYLSSGRLKVFLSYGDKIFTLAILNRGDIYCTHTRAFVEAMEESEVKSCDLQTFSHQMHQHPQLMGAMTRVLSTTLSGCFDTIENLAFRDVKARFAGFLLGQMPQEQMAKNEVLITLPLTTEQLAQVIGTSRQTISSLISEWQAQGMIKRAGRGKLLVHSPKQLERLAN